MSSFATRLSHRDRYRSPWPLTAFGIILELAVFVVPQTVSRIHDWAIRREIKANSGRPSRDAIDRIERKLDEDVETGAARLSALTERLDQHDGNQV